MIIWEHYTSMMMRYLTSIKTKGRKLPFFCYMGFFNSPCRWRSQRQVFGFLGIPHKIACKICATCTTLAFPKSFVQFTQRRHTLIVQCDERNSLVQVVQTKTANFVQYYLLTFAVFYGIIYL